jgi:hypothetical protein
MDQRPTTQEILGRCANRPWCIAFCLLFQAAVNEASIGAVASFCHAKSQAILDEICASEPIRSRIATMRKLAAEILGTFALVFTGTGAIVINDVTGGTVSHVGIALTFGLIVLAMIMLWGRCQALTLILP